MKSLRSVLLRSQADGGLPRGVSYVLALLALAVAAVCWYVVFRALPGSDTPAHWALSVLLLGAINGLTGLFELLIKVWQGGRVLPSNSNPLR